MPCQSPPQNPAGRASGFLYFEFEPATESAFAISARNYRTNPVGVKHALAWAFVSPCEGR
jgi:hypothetical protein